MKPFNCPMCVTSVGVGVLSQTKEKEEGNEEIIFAISCLSLVR